MREEFKKTLIELTEKDDKIFYLGGDMALPEFKEKFPERYINIGTCEQSIVSLASGMAIEGLRPFVYAITPFILERPFEQVKIGLDQQNVPVILVGYDDYPKHGTTHTTLNAEGTSKLFKNIKSYFPKNSQETREAIIDAYESNGPAFIRLKRNKPDKKG